MNSDQVKDELVKIARFSLFKGSKYDEDFTEDELRILSTDPSKICSQSRFKTSILDREIQAHLEEMYNSVDPSLPQAKRKKQVILVANKRVAELLEIYRHEDLGYLVRVQNRLLIYENLLIKALHMNSGSAMQTALVMTQKLRKGVDEIIMSKAQEALKRT